MTKKEEQAYFEVTTKCTNCGSEYIFGTTTENLNIEICGECHPFYTGKQSLVDTAGRIEKFKARMSKVSDSSSDRKEKKRKARKAKLSIADLTSSKEEKPAKKTKKKEVKPKEEEKEVKAKTKEEKTDDKE